ncbi:MAG: PEP-CTERM sorting domain-containing protein [Gimesia sp.]
MVKSTLRVKNQNGIVHLIKKQNLQKKDFKMKLFVYSTAVALMLCSSASASLVIDDFSQAVVFMGAADSLGPTALDDGVIGTRTITTFGLSDGSSGGNIASGFDVGGSSVELTTSTTDGFVTIVYDFTGGPVDLHSTGAFPGSPLKLDLFNSVLGSFDLDVTYEGLGGVTSTTSFVISGPGAVGVSGSLFGNGALASAVDKLTLKFTANTLDTGFASFSSNSASIAAVPEPTSLALLGASMFGGFGVVARRRKKKLVTEVKA